MPHPKGTRYRWKTTKSGKKVRLAFAPGSNRVVEVKKKGGRAKNVKQKRKKRGTRSR